MEQSRGSGSGRDVGRGRTTVWRRSISCRHSSARHPRVRAAVRATGPGSGTRWLPRRRWVLVFWLRKPQPRGPAGCGAHRECRKSADSVSGSAAPGARCVPGSRAVHRRLGASGARVAGRTPRSDRLVGHSRGGAESLQYVLAIGNVQAIILHDAGHAARPVIRAAEFNVPILILHGTADGPAGGGSANTDVALAREFEAALRRNKKPVEAHYYEGGGNNTCFTNPTQRDDELKRMIEFLRRYLGT